MVCIVLVGAMVGFFGLAAAAGIGILLKAFDTYSDKGDINNAISNLMLPLIGGFLGGAALVWFYNSVAACRPG